MNSTTEPCQTRKPTSAFRLSATQPVGCSLFVGVNLLLLRREFDPDLSATC